MNILKHRIWVFRITLRQLNTTILLWLFIYLFVNFKFVERWSITMRNKSVKNVKQNGRSVWLTTVCLSKGEKNPKSYSGDNLVKKRGTKRGPETYLCTIESTEHQLSTAGSPSSLMMSRSLPAFSCFSLHGS